MITIILIIMGFCLGGLGINVVMISIKTIADKKRQEKLIESYWHIDRLEYEADLLLKNTDPVLWEQVKSLDPYALEGRLVAALTELKDLGHVWKIAGDYGELRCKRCKEWQHDMMFWKNTPSRKHKGKRGVCEPKLKELYYQERSKSRW